MAFEAALLPNTQPAMAMEMISSGEREKIVKYARDAAIRIPLSSRKLESAALVSLNNVAGLARIDFNRMAFGRYSAAKRRADIRSTRYPKRRLGVRRTTTTP